MPLGKNISSNVSELYEANKSKSKKRSRRQIIAIAIAAAKRNKSNKK